MRLITFAAVLAMSLVLSGRVWAQTPEDRMATALALALTLGDEGADRQETLRQLNAELAAILSEHPSSPVARALLAPGPRGQTSLLQQVQARLTPVPEPAAECAGVPAILDLSERILSQRKDMPGFSSASFGGTATYLWLHYAQPDAATAMDRFQQIARDGRRPPRDLDGLVQTWAVATMGVEQGLGLFGPQRESVLAHGDTNVLRAILLADDGDSFFHLLARVRQDAPLNEIFDQRWFKGQNFASLLIDIDDDRKLRIANRAAAAGEIVFAAQLLGSRSDLTDYRELIASHPDDEMLQRTSPDWVGLMMERDAPLEPSPTQTFRAMPRNIFDAYRAAMLVGEADFLMIVMNQTGWEREVGDVARDFLAELDAGRLRTVGNLEANWLFLYDAIAAQVTPQRLQSVMSSFDVSSRTRHYSGRAQQVVDWMRAVSAAAPFAAGTAPAPNRPANLSAAFPWDDWMRIAGRIRQGGGPVFSTPDEAQIAAELLAFIGRIPDAVNVAEQGMEIDARLKFYRDIMQRLDRTCGAYTVSPGQSLLLGGAIMWRF